MTKDEALKLAQEALESARQNHGLVLTSYPTQEAWHFHRVDEKISVALTAIKKALEKPEQEPALSDEEAEKIFLEMWEMGNEAIRNEQRKKLKGKKP